MANTGLDEAGLKAEIIKAREASIIANTIEPRADSAYYEQSSNRIIINLKSGATFSFPTGIAQGLSDASPEDLAEVEVTPSGDGLHWEKLDADFSVPALLAGVFGTEAWMAELRLKRSQSVQESVELLQATSENLSGNRLRAKNGSTTEGNSDLLNS